MHAKAVVDRSCVWEEDGSPDSTSRVPSIGDIDMSTVNRVLYQVTCSLDASCAHRPRRLAYFFLYAESCKLCAVHSVTFPLERNWHCCCSTSGPLYETARL